MSIKTTQEKTRAVQPIDVKERCEGARLKLTTRSVAIPPVRTSWVSLIMVGNHSVKACHCQRTGALIIVDQVDIELHQVIEIRCLLIYQNTSSYFSIRKTDKILPI